MKKQKNMKKTIIISILGFCLVCYWCSDEPVDNSTESSALYYYEDEEPQQSQQIVPTSTDIPQKLRGNWTCSETYVENNEHCKNTYQLAIGSNTISLQTWHFEGLARVLTAQDRSTGTCNYIENCIVATFTTGDYQGQTIALDEEYGKIKVGKLVFSRGEAF